ncbi:PadR family transcriptional regulator [Nocardia beijingensis]
MTTKLSTPPRYCNKLHKHVSPVTRHRHALSGPATWRRAACATSFTRRYAESGGAADSFGALYHGAVALQFAILTALTERASTGIELARRFDRAFGYFWSATHQQIYRELDRLSGGGLVAEVAQPQSPGRGQPRRFAITPAGTAALRRWVNEVDEPPQQRETLLIRLRAAAATGDFEGVREVVTHHLDVHERTLATYREIQARDFSDVGGDADAMRHLVLKAGLGTERAWVDWCREVIEALDAMQTPSESRSR